MAKMMWQSVLTAPKKSTLEQRPLPTPEADEVLIKVRLCGVCASEMHPWLHANAEREFGHEVVGEIVDIGAEVVGLEPNMRVTGLIVKGFAKYALAPAHVVTAVPDSLSDEAALGEPLSCVISGMRRTAIDLGDTVALIGLGYMGLLTLQVARLKGAAELIALDTRAEAQQRALNYGANTVFHPDDVPDHFLLEAWQDIPKAYGLDVAIEATGNPHALALAGRLTKAHGILSIVGYHQGDAVPIDMQMWNWKALAIINAHERRQDYQMDCMRRGLRLVELGKLDTASLLTHRFGLEQVDQAFCAMLDKPEDFIKAVIQISD